MVSRQPLPHSPLYTELTEQMQQKVQAHGHIHDLRFTYEEHTHSETHVIYEVYCSRCNSNLPKVRLVYSTSYGRSIGETLHG